jgi:hypothetical protein
MARLFRSLEYQANMKLDSKQLICVAEETVRRELNGDVGRFERLVHCIDGI